MKKRLLSFIIVLVIVLTASIPAQAIEFDPTLKGTSIGNIDEYEIKQLWAGGTQYPITPKMKEFGKYTLSELQKILNPPQELLNSLSNKELASLMMDYPLLVNLFAFETPEKALNALEKSCTVFTEVLKRRGIESALLDEYETRNLDIDYFEGKKTYNETENYGNIPGFVFVDYYFSTYGNILSDTIIKRYTSLRSQKAAEYKVLYNEITGGQLSISGEDKTVHNSVSNENNIRQAYYSDWFEGFNSYVSVTIPLPIPYISHTTYYQEGAYYKGGVVGLCWKFSSNDFSAPVKNFLNSLYNGYSGFAFLSTATTKYNCHSYAWINKSFSNVYWLNDPSNFSSTYSFVNSGGRAQAGDRIIIYDYTDTPCHSVCVTSGGNYQSQITVESKLGNDGVYRTSLADMMSLYQGYYYYVYR